MKVKSIRIPEDIDTAVGYVAKIEKIDVNQSFRKLTRIGFEHYIGKLYEDGKIDIREVAVLLNLSLSESIDALLAMGIKGNIHSADVFDSMKTISQDRP